MSVLTGVLRPMSAMLRLGAVNALHFRANVAVGVFSVLLQTVLLMTVWRAVYAGRDVVSDVPQDRAVAYAIFAVAIAHMVLPSRLSSLPDRVRMGTVATDVIRPIGVVTQNLAMTFGGVIGAVPGVVTGLVLGGLLGGLQAPASAGHAALFAVAVLLGLALSIVLNFAVSMVSFWTTDTRGPVYIYRTIASFGSGALVPLWFMPGGLSAVLELLPFQLQVFAPLQIWFGDVEPAAAVGVLGMQVLWLGLLTLLMIAIAHRALRKVVIHGG